MSGLWKLLRRFVAPYRKYMIANLVCNLLSALLTIFSFAVIIPILEMLFQVREPVDYVYMSLGETSIKDVVLNNFYYYTQEAIAAYGQPMTLALLALLLVVMTGLKTGVQYLCSYFLIPLRTGVVRDLRNTLYDKILRLPIGFYTHERKGDVMARMTGDVTEVETSVMSSLEIIFKDPVMIIVCLLMMIFISWQLTIFVLVLLPLAGALMGNVGKRLKRKSLEAQNQWGSLLSNIEETIGGLRVIKAFNAEGKMRHRFREATDLYRRLVMRVERRRSLAHPMSEFLGTLTIAIVLWFGGSLILSGASSLTAPSFIYYLVVFYSLISPAKSLSKSTYDIQKGIASMERIDKILLAPNPIHDPKHPVKVEDFKGEVRYDNVTFSYREGDPVVEDISLTIKPGETVALVGASGSGKSTLADLLPRFYDIDKGSITVDGVDIRDIRIHDLRAWMGNVNQEAILFNDTVYNNITFGVKGEVKREEVIAAARTANAHDFIEAMEHSYDTNIGDRGCRLSGGQRQRLSIARAILKNPPILILDEATSALDSESELLVQQALERLMVNRTTLVIAHRLSTIRNASQICVMHEGRIVERGTHDELLALPDGFYSKLVAMQGLA